MKATVMEIFEVFQTILREIDEQNTKICSGLRIAPVDLSLLVQASFLSDELRRCRVEIELPSDADAIWDKLFPEKVEKPIASVIT